MFESSALHLTYKRQEGFSLSSLLRKSHGLLDSCGARQHKAAGLCPPACPLVCATLPAASPQTLRATHTTLAQWCLRAPIQQECQYKLKLSTCVKVPVTFQTGFVITHVPCEIGIIACRIELVFSWHRNKTHKTRHLFTFVFQGTN